MSANENRGACHALDEFLEVVLRRIQLPVGYFPEAYAGPASAAPRLQHPANLAGWDAPGHARGPRHRQMAGTEVGRYLERTANTLEDSAVVAPQRPPSGQVADQIRVVLQATGVKPGPGGEIIQGQHIPKAVGIGARQKGHRQTVGEQIEISKQIGTPRLQPRPHRRERRGPWRWLRRSAGSSSIAWKHPPVAGPPGSLPRSRPRPPPAPTGPPAAAAARAAIRRCTRSNPPSGEIVRAGASDRA